MGVSELAGDVLAVHSLSGVIAASMYGVPHTFSAGAGVTGGLCRSPAKHMCKLWFE